MSKGKQTFMITLSCGHTITYASPAPLLGDEVYCRKCTEYRHVMSAPSEFSVFCRDCRYSRGYGAGKLTAQYAADRHAAKHPSHTVDLYDGTRRIETRTAKPVQLDLLAELDKPPF